MTSGIYIGRGTAGLEHKPDFWDYYNAVKKVKKDDEFLPVYSKDTGKLTVYYHQNDIQNKPAKYISGILSFLLLVGIAIVSFKYSLWPNFNIDGNMLNAGIGLLSGIMVYRYTYNKSEFKTVPYEEWEQSEQSKRKPRGRARMIWRYSALFLALLAFFNTYFFTYLRYQYEGGSFVSAAEVTLGMHENSIVLDDSTPENSVLYGLPDRETIIMNISLIRIPEEASVYLNGVVLERGYFKKHFHFFWQEDYFKSTGHVYFKQGELKEHNTLEIRTKDFSKAWTFMLGD
jgi:hypothetical protein